MVQVVENDGVKSFQRWNRSLQGFISSSFKKAKSAGENSRNICVGGENLSSKCEARNIFPLVVTRPSGSSESEPHTNPAS